MSKALVLVRPQLYHYHFPLMRIQIFRTRFPFLMNQKTAPPSGRFGYIIAVLSTLDVSAGTIQPGTGMAEFVIKYSAIVLKPFKGEVVDGIVGQVNKMGFFVEVGPLQAFVSSHLIPSDLKFDPNANPPCFSSDEDQATIEKGTRIRLKIVGTRVDATEIFAIGTIKEDYLGPID
ncbi:hypothetical protein KEM48_003482 [Puccinia striiformis f. sp. tritici PST-130]|nr:hypothetical protein Pst134EB_012071 [Puccinia striiformis f. sp. tritici]KAI9607695.1 hypothetical protein KEM48_003482 [Puccinia striiformis f. sp. tritici PST-130]